MRQGQEHIAVTFKIDAGKGEVFVHLLVRRVVCRLCLVVFNLWCTVDTVEEQWQNTKPLWAIIFAIMGS